MADNNQATQNKESSSESKNSTSFEIRKIYLKDTSLECPNSPGIFLDSIKSPEVSIDATIKVEKLEQEGYYDVALGITVTSKVEEKTAFLVEVHQAGVFHIAGVSNQDMPVILQVACPNVLLPFAREAVSDLVTKAGFPQLLLSPINFEGLYQQKLAQEKAAQQNAGDSKTQH